MLKVTRVRRKAIDRIAAFVEEENEKAYAEFSAVLDGEKVDGWKPAAALYDAPLFAFSFYALAIVHCYSLVENNRALLCERLPGISRRERRSLHNIQTVTSCLNRARVQHDRTRCYRTMETFREVNNAIKHCRLGLSHEIVTRSGQKYEPKQLRALYARAKYLERYLEDLYRRVSNLHGQ